MNCHNIEWFPGDTCLICEHIHIHNQTIAGAIAAELAMARDQLRYKQENTYHERMLKLRSEIMRGLIK